MPKTLEFFFDFMSPYSYLASTQVEAVCARTGATLLWRPFLLGPVFKATENAGPLATPAKAAYIRKDLDDWADHYGIPRLVFPAEFPFRILEAARLALVAAERGKAGGLRAGGVQRHLGGGAGPLPAGRAGGGAEVGGAGAWTRHRAGVLAGDQGRAAAERGRGGVARLLRRAHLLHRRRHVPGQRPPAVRGAGAVSSLKRGIRRRTSWQACPAGNWWPAC